MKKLHKAILEYLHFKNKLNCKNTFLIYDTTTNNYIVSIYITKEYITQYHFVNVY